jgi:hypothetical protein
MDLNHVAGELAGPRHDDLTREQFAGRILAALESVQSETVRQTLERAIKVCGAIASRQEPQPLRNVGIECMTTLLALIDKPAVPDPTVVALARFFRSITYFEGVGLATHVLDTCRVLGLTHGNGAPTEFGKSALALAEGGS